MGKEKAALIKKIFLFFIFFILLSGIVLLFFPEFSEIIKESFLDEEKWKEKTEKITLWEDLTEIYQTAQNRVVSFFEYWKERTEEQENRGKILPFLVTCDACLPCASQKITSDFGERINPISNQKEYHKGIDLAIAEGQAVCAGWPGTIVECGFDEIYGNYIVISHFDGFETKYAHLSTINTQKDIFVKAGEKIGEAGKTGWATGSHLHFEVMIQGQSIDPKEYLPLC